MPEPSGHVVEGEEDTGQDLEDDQDEDHAAEAVVEGVGVVRHPLGERLVDGLGEGKAGIQPVDDRQLDVSRMWDRHSASSFPIRSL